MNERDPMIEAIRRAGEVPPPPGREEAFDRAMAAIPDEPSRSRPWITLLVAAALGLAVPAGGLLAVHSRGPDRSPRPATSSPTPDVTTGNDDRGGPDRGSDGDGSEDRSGPNRGSDDPEEADDDNSGPGGGDDDEVEEPEDPEEPEEPEEPEGTEEPDDDHSGSSSGSSGSGGGDD